jgi:hypothetical protein
MTGIQAARARFGDSMNSTIQILAGLRFQQVSFFNR